MRGVMRLLDAVRYGDARSCSASRVVALGLVGVSAYLGLTVQFWLAPGRGRADGVDCSLTLEIAVLAG
jgi:hypothetical protein